MSYRRPSADSGFTLAELMFVIAILGILVLVAVASYVVASDKAGKAACRANERILETAVIAYQADNDGARPATLGDLADYVSGSDYDDCPSTGIDLVYDKGTGDVSCPDHP